MERKPSAVIAPVATEDRFPVTEPQRQVGGPQSGLPPLYEIAQDMAPYLIVGIDFGTIDCRVCTFLEGEPRPLHLSMIESQIHFPGYATDPLARHASTIDVKNILGKPFKAKVENLTFNPVDLTIPVLQRVKRDAESLAEKLLAKAVITTPACATHTFRQDMLEAAELAEMNVIGLLNETTAIGLYWSFVNSHYQGTFIAFSLGATHWEAALIVRHERLLEVRAHACRSAPTEEANEKQVFMDIAKQLLEESHTPPTEVKIAVVGGRAGSDKQMRAAMRKVLPLAEVKDRLDERGAAAGAAVFAALIVRQAKDLAVWDCVATATLVGEEFSIHPLIAEQSPIPISGHFNFKATADKAQFQVVQRAQNETATRNVCSVIVQDIPASTDTPRNIDIEVHATVDGTLSFNAKDIQLDSNLRITVEPAVAEVEVLEFFPMVHKEDSLTDGEPQNTGQCGIVVANVYGKWLIKYVDPRVSGIHINSELLSIDGQPVASLPFNPHHYLMGPTAKWVNIEIKPPEEAATTLAVQCNIPHGTGDDAKLDTLITVALLAADYELLVILLIMYGHACYRFDKSTSKHAFGSAVVHAMKHLGSQEPLYTMALARQCWFYLKQNSPAKTIRDCVQKICTIDAQRTSDGSAKYIYELVCTFESTQMQVAFAAEVEQLLIKAIEIAHATCSPPEVINVYEQKRQDLKEISS